MSSASNEKIEKACEAAFEKFKKINKPEFADIQSKLEYVIGSYRYEKILRTPKLVSLSVFNLDHALGFVMKAQNAIRSSV
jgi:hypothetical protein